MVIRNIKDKINLAREFRKQPNGIIFYRIKSEEIRKNVEEILNQLEYFINNNNLMPPLPLGRTGRG